MGNGKYSYRVVEEGDSLWKAEIMRKVTAKKHAVSKAKSGFVSESEAKKWAEAELEIFIKTLAERNQRRAVRKAAVAEEAHGEENDQ